MVNFAINLFGGEVLRGVLVLLQVLEGLELQEFPGRQTLLRIDLQALVDNLVHVLWKVLEYLLEWLGWHLFGEAAHQVKELKSLLVNPLGVNKVVFKRSEDDE